MYLTFSFRNRPCPLPTSGELTPPTGGLNSPDLTHCFLQVLLISSVVDNVRVFNLIYPSFQPENCCFTDGGRPRIPRSVIQEFAANDTTIEQTNGVVFVFTPHIDDTY